MIVNEDKFKYISKRPIYFEPSLEVNIRENIKYHIIKFYDKIRFFDYVNPIYYLNSPENANISLFRNGGLQTLTRFPGIYFLFDDYKELVYIGKTQHGLSRIQTHLNENKKNFKYFYYMDIPYDQLINGGDLEDIEMSFIVYYKPKYNKIINEYFPIDKIKRQIYEGYYSQLNANYDLKYSFDEVNNIILKRYLEEDLEIKINWNKIHIYDYCCLKCYLSVYYEEDLHRILNIYSPEEFGYLKEEHPDGYGDKFYPYETGTYDKPIIYKNEYEIEQ